MLSRPPPRRPRRGESAVFPAAAWDDGGTVTTPAATDPARIRNFCIIAHIDHGKSTLADRMLEVTGIIEARQMRAQYLDRMDIERERGITIKAQNVRLPWTPTTGDEAGVPHVLHMIDTPGHVDFTYEVSRSLAACEGAVLLVDAAQGIEAQTLANLYLALENDLHIIPVLNKIDLPAAQPEKYAEEIAHIIGCEPGDVLRVSGKTGEGVPELLDLIVDEIPAPTGDAAAPARAMIFDSVYDIYRGVITYVRVVDGRISARERIRMMSTGATHELLEIGVISPEPKPVDSLGVGEVGYLITGVKDVRQSRVGDTVTLQNRPAAEPLGGYQDPKPMVYSGLYPIDGSEYGLLREALDKLALNDAALVYEPETSAALGFGFRVGFLGLLHLEIVRERLERESGLSLISTAPNVVYRVVMEDGTERTVTNPSDWPSSKIDTVHEPIVNATIIAPSDYTGTIMELCQSRRGSLTGMDYLSESRVELRYTLPLGEIIFDFFDALKSRTRGYASLDYSEAGEQQAQLVKVDILLQGEPVDAFSAIVHKDKAYSYGVMMAGKLRELIPRQQFEVPIQAAVGSRVIARETIRAIRKDVLAKCYGGDISRKRKLLEKQKEGKKRMKMVGRVEVPQEAFVAALSNSSESAKK
jgi:GTP-binding protein LepA